MRSRSRFIVLSITSVLLAGSLRAQNNVGINNPTPHASALLDLTSTDKGLLTPRMTTAQRTAIAMPATGLLVFDTTLNNFYYYNGTAWVMLTSGAAGWALNGNAGTNPALNFIGTLDLVPLNFRIGMVRAGTLDFVNTSMGWLSGGMSMTGTQNSFFGAGAGASTTSGNNNVFAGHITGNGITQGARNTAVGSMSGVLATVAVDNTFLGFQTGLANTGSTNTFIGSRAGQANLGAANNVFVGFQSGMANNTGAVNTFMGTSSGAANTSGSDNTFLGTSAGLTNTIGGQNTFVGRSAGRLTLDGDANTFIGRDCGWANSTGNQNTYLGANAGHDATGSSNTFIGWNAAAGMTSGTQNTYLGWNAGVSSTGSQNTLLGHNVAAGMTSGSSNTLLGYQAGWGTTSGNFNTSVGYHAGYNVAGGTNNTFLGSNSGLTASNLTNATAIGFNAQVVASNSLVLGGTGVNAVNVGIGTTAPAYGAHIVRAASNSAPVGIQNLNNDGVSGTLYHGSAGTLAAVSGWANTTNSYAPNTFVQGTLINSPATFLTNGAERMRILANGDVGIGTNAPASRLHVAVSAAGYVPNPNAELTVESGGNVYANVISGAGETGILFGSSGNATNGGVVYNSGYTPNGLQLRTGGNVPHLSITSTGDVTIAPNAAWPGYKLGVIGNQTGAMAALQNQEPAGYTGFDFHNNTGAVRGYFGVGNSASPNWTNMAYAGTRSPDPFVLVTNDVEHVRIDAGGNVGIGTTAPGSMLEVSGYTKLGSNAPAVRMIKFAGNTAAVQGGTTTIAHGLPAPRILAVDVLVEASPGVFIPDAYLHSPGQQFTFTYNATNIVVVNSLTNSGLILSRPFKVLVTYEQ